LLDAALLLVAELSAVECLPVVLLATALVVAVPVVTALLVTALLATAPLAMALPLLAPRPELPVLPELVGNTRAPASSDVPNPFEVPEQADGAPSASAKDKTGIERAAWFFMIHPGAVTSATADMTIGGIVTPSTVLGRSRGSPVETPHSERNIAVMQDDHDEWPNCAAFRGVKIHRLAAGGGPR
jgi:hypothetical protein